MKYLYLIILVILFFSCEKEKPTNKPIDNSDACILIPPSQSMIGYDYKIDSFTIERPCFNPNNSDEIVFFIKTYSSNITSKLIKYNLKTFEKEILLEAELYFQPSWANNDWIIFGLKDENIWKIKSNGDSLTQLTFIGSNFNPECNYNSNRIICSNTNQGCSFIYDFYGNSIDTLNMTSSAFDWNADNQILIKSDNGTYRYNYNTKELILYNENYYPIHFMKAQWINEDEFITSGDDGINSNGAIYKTNILTGNIECIKEYCNAWIYNFPDYSPQLDKLIWQKVKKKKIGDNLIEVKFVLVLMNTDGTNEQEIEIK